MKRLEKYLLVTDMDGTLYSNQNFITEENRKAIKRFCDLGGKFTIASGRGICTSRFITEMLDFNCPLIVNNGRTFYDYKNEKMVMNFAFPESAKPFVLDLMKKFPSVAVEIFSGDKLYVLRDNQTLIEHLIYEKAPYKINSFSEVEKLDWEKVLFEDSLENLNKVRHYAKKHCPSDLGLIDTNPLFMEFARPDIDKGTGILKLADYYNIPHKNVCAIGNYYNDREMILAAGIGAYVFDSPDELKKEADYICNATCAENGFAEFVDYIINIQK